MLEAAAGTGASSEQGRATPPASPPPDRSWEERFKAARDDPRNKSIFTKTPAHDPGNKPEK